jgi:hypothetical protein
MNTPQVNGRFGLLKMIMTFKSKNVHLILWISINWMGTRIGFIWWINVIMMVYNPVHTWEATGVEQQLEAARCTQVLYRCF